MASQRMYKGNVYSTDAFIENYDPDMPVCAPSMCPAVTKLFLVALQGVAFCLKFVFYCRFMPSVLMSSSTSQQKMHEGWG